MFGKLKMAAAAAAALATLGWAQPASANNIVVNGGFEQVSGLVLNTPNPSHPEWTLFNTAAGWTDTSNGPGNTLIFSGREGYSEGQRAAIFGSGGGTTGTLSQTQNLATVAGTTYYLEFDYGGYQGVASLNFNVGGGLLAGSVSDFSENLPGSDNPNPNVDPFVHAVYTFTATSNSTSLTFFITESGSSTDMVLDNVSVQTVPEPGSVALAGLGVAALAARRRKARR